MLRQDCIDLNLITDKISYVKSIAISKGTNPSHESCRILNLELSDLESAWDDFMTCDCGRNLLIKPELRVSMSFVCNN